MNADELFRRFFAPVYPPDAIADLAKARSTDANPGKNPGILAQIAEAAGVFARLAPQALQAPDLVLDYSDASVHRLSAQLTRARRDALLGPARREQPVGTGGDAAGTLVQLVTHGVFYVGECIVRGHGGVWQVRRPLWESTVRLHSRAGTADLAIFQWWLKSLADDEIDGARLVDRYRAHVEQPTRDVSALPRIAPGDRKLPRLAKVRYAALYQHLRAHLPELKSLGDDFPSAERLEELRFAWLDFALLGDGRMLLMHGPAVRGVHLYWLDAAGFAQAAFYPGEGPPTYSVEIDGDVLRLTLTVRGERRVHEMLWWGP